MIYLVLRNNGVCAAVDTSRLTAGNTVAHCDCDSIGLVLVGPVAADTASFDHSDGVIERDGLISTKFDLFYSQFVEAK